MADIGKVGAGAYTEALKQLKQSSDANATGPGGFADMVKNSLNSAVESQHKSEKVSAAALSGEANMTDVIQSITDAEVALNTVVAIRDKVIQAYDNIMHMPI